MKLNWHYPLWPEVKFIDREPHWTDTQIGLRRLFTNDFTLTSMQYAVHVCNLRTPVWDFVASFSNDENEMFSLELLCVRRNVK